LARSSAESRIAVTGSCSAGGRPRCFRDFMKETLAVAAARPVPAVRQPDNLMYGNRSAPCQFPHNGREE
jgi:hypothetical protein